MHLKNLTPHTLHLHGPKGVTVLDPVGEAPRLAVDREYLGTIAWMPIVRSTMGAPQGLPPPREGTIVIVSALVAEACPERDDLAYPGEAIREGGRVVGARGLCAGPGLAARIRDARVVLSEVE